MIPSTPNHRAWLRFKRNRLASYSAGLFLLLLLVTLTWPFFAQPAAAAWAPRPMTHSPNALSDLPFSPPDSLYWFGSDMHGRDVSSRVMAGARISMFVGLVGAGVSLFIGVAWGAIAGYAGGRVDSVMMRTVDVLYSLPSIVLVIVLITTLEGFLKAGLAASIFSGWTGSARLLFLFVGLGAVSWLTMARIVRGEVLSLRHRHFVEASAALGAGHRHVLTRHILPNISGVILAYLALTIPSIILYESFLSFLGLGIQPPQASLGSLLADGVAQINPIRVYWWLIVFPGEILTLLLLTLSFIADGLRDAFDPRSAD